MNRTNLVPTINIAKKLFLGALDKHGEDQFDLRTHVTEAVRWANKLLSEYPKLNSDVIFLSIWLHDIGHYPIDKNDHAVKSEKIAKNFLAKQKVNKDIAKEVLHCVRSHRNKDIKPNTNEAKFFAALDSISHFTYAPYLGMMRDGRGKAGMEKLERDYRDLKYLPKIKKELTPLYQAWKKLLQEINKQDLY